MKTMMVLPFKKVVEYRDDIMVSLSIIHHHNADVWLLDDSRYGHEPDKRSLLCASFLQKSARICELSKIVVSIVGVGTQT